MKFAVPRTPLLFAILLLAGAGWLQADCFTDPLMPGQDPQVARQNGYFHLVQSDGCRIHLRRSSTLGGLATTADTVILSPGCSNVWAPEIHWISNKWYLYYSLGNPDHPNHRVYVAESQGTSVYGPYTIRGILYNGFWNIDGSVFTANDGRLYFLFSGSPTDVAQNIYIAPMSNPYTLSGPPVLISQPTQSWEIHGAPPPVNEGPFGFTRNGRTFIAYSASGCWTDDYCLGLLTLSGGNPLDPNAWTKSGPVFSKQTGAYGPGHNCVLVDDAGQWWNVYHANNFSGQGCGGNRQIRIQRLSWDASGAPVFGSPVPLGSWITDDPDFLDAQYLLNQTGGSLALNQGCGPAGTLVGPPVWKNGGLWFNGVDDYVDGTPFIGNDVQTAVTLAAWIRPESFVDWAGILTKGTNTSPYAMQLWSDGSLRFSANWGSPAGGVGGGSWNSAAKLKSNEWQHVAVTYDGTRIRFYLNGQLDANQPAANLRFGVVDESLTMGADLPGGDEYFNGTIRDARVYGRALSGAEIKSLALPNLGLVTPQFSTNETIVAAATPQQFGARGDGVTDDSAAFQNAMDVVGAAGGGVVYVPAGTYAFYTNLVIPTGVTLHGDWTDWTRGTNGVQGTLFKIYAGAGQTNGDPFIFLNGSTALRGVNFWYPNQDANNLTGYPFTIGLYGDCVVQDVALINSYQGIQVTPPTSGGKHILSTVIGSPLYQGIDLDMIADISHAEDIRFSPGVWPASKLPGAPAADGPQAVWMRTHGTGMRLRRVDGEACMDTFISGYQVGIEASRSTNGSPGATFYSGAVSNCAVALLAQEMAGQSGLQFTRFTLDGDTGVTRTSNDTATVEFQECHIIGRDGTAVRLTGGWQSWMQFQNCDISGTLQLDGGVFNVVNSRLSVSAGGHQCVLGANAIQAAFTGCFFSPTRSIANTGDSRKVIIDGRRPLSSPLPVADWAAIKRDYLARKPAKRAVYVATQSPWNAAGDGVADDTAAIQNALNAAGANGGGMVYLPGGKYRLTNTIDVPSGVELRGPYELRHRTWPAPDGHAKGSVLEPYGGQGTTNGPPAIALEANSGLVGVTISYEAQNTNATPYPPAIQGRGGNVYIIGVVCPNPYYYVDLDTYTCTNHFLYMVDGWALKTGFCVGNGSSGSIVDCQGNWTYWWDNYASRSVLSPDWREPILNFAEHNLDMYVLGNCTELMAGDFVIPAHTMVRCISENGRGPDVNGVSVMGDQCGEGYRLEAAAPCNLNFINSTLAIFADYPDLTNQTVGVISTPKFQGTARFFNTALFGGPDRDFVSGGGDIGFELVHMLDHSAVGSTAAGGVFHLVNNAAYITYHGTNVFPTYAVNFGSGAGLAGKLSEVVGCYAYHGISVTNADTNNPVWNWNNYELATLTNTTDHEVSSPKLSWDSGSMPQSTALSWPGDIGAFDLYSATDLTPPVLWFNVSNELYFATNQWSATVTNFGGRARFFRLQQ